MHAACSTMRDRRKEGRRTLVSPAAQQLTKKAESARCLPRTRIPAEQSLRRVLATSQHCTTQAGTCRLIAPSCTGEQWRSRHPFLHCCVKTSNSAKIARALHFGRNHSGEVLGLQVGDCVVLTSEEETFMPDQPPGYNRSNPVARPPHARHLRQSRGRAEIMTGTDLVRYLISHNPLLPSLKCNEIFEKASRRGD